MRCTAGKFATIAFAILAGVQTAAASQTDVSKVVQTYSDIALAGYEDSLTAARSLSKSIDVLVKTPSAEALLAARNAWKAARIPYMQTEVYRFGNKIVDEWEGRVNAWPLDEGLIDYVAPSYGKASDSNKLYTANVIANRNLVVAGRKVDASRITKSLLKDKLHEAERVEANVATGYHAVEFLLWGQDLNGTGPGAGNRPHTDFDTKNCTGGNCDRRIAYLKTSMQLLIDDLDEMVKNWQAKGKARQELMRNENAALVAIFTGMGSLSYGELAGERMKLGLLLNDPEEEHDCFSDNTHNSHYYDVLGIKNVYLGHYTRTDGRVVSGPSVSDLVKERSNDVDVRVRTALDETMARMDTLKKRAETVEAYDQMIGEGNAEGNAVVEAAIGALIGQTKEIERAVAALELKPIQFEGSQSLDDPSKIDKK